MVLILASFQVYTEMRHLNKYIFILVYSCKPLNPFLLRLISLMGPRISFLSDTTTLTLVDRIKVVYMDFQFKNYHDLNICGVMCIPLLTQH